MHLLGFVQSSRNEGSNRYHQTLFRFQVPGLAENRPSVIRGDQILVRMKDRTGQLEKEEYQGFVHLVGLSEVRLRFSPRYKKNL